MRAGIELNMIVTEGGANKRIQHNPLSFGILHRMEVLEHFGADKHSAPLPAVEGAVIVGIAYPGCGAALAGFP